MAEWKCKSCQLYHAETADAYRVTVGKYDPETETLEERSVVQPLCEDCFEHFKELGY